MGKGGVGRFGANRLTACLDYAMIGLEGMETAKPMLILGFRNKLRH